MKRAPAVLSFAAAAALLLGGCSAVSESTDSDYIDLSNPANVSALCGDLAMHVLSIIEPAVKADPSSGQHNQLKNWQIDPKNEKAQTTILDALQKRAKVSCDEANPSSDPDPTPTEDTPDANQDDLDAAAAELMLDSKLWGNLDWEYPTEWADLALHFNYQTVTFSGETFPKLETGSTKWAEKTPGWLDAVRPPLTDKTEDEVLARIISETDFGFQVCTGLSYMTLKNGPTLLELDPFLEECRDIDHINDMAQAALDGTPAEQILVAKKLVVVAMLMQRIGMSGVETDTSLFNIHLVYEAKGGALSVNPRNLNEIPEFEFNPVQYTGEFLIFEVRLKGQSGCVMRFGINSGDGRFANLGCIPPPSSGCAPNCGSGDCTSGCGGDCTSSCDSDCVQRGDCKGTYVPHPGDGGGGDDEGVGKKPKVKKVKDPAKDPDPVPTSSPSPTPTATPQSPGGNGIVGK